MRRFEDSTFVFISTNPTHEPEGVESRWLAVMRDLTRRGATVRFLCLPGSPLEAAAREAGAHVDPYVLDKWNMVRSHTRLRKYLKRLLPVAVHSTGLEADLLARWAARKIPDVQVAHTLTADPQGTRRHRPVDALMRRFDELGMRNVGAVFVESEEIAGEVRAVGVPESRVHLDLPSAGPRRAVDRHVSAYRGFMAERGAGR